MFKKTYTFPMTIYHGTEAKIVNNQQEWAAAQTDGWIDSNPWLKNGSKWGERPEPQEKE